MRHAWFEKFAWFYKPTAWPGWLALILTLIFCVHVFVAVDRHSHSASDTLYGALPFWVSAWTIFGWVASRTTVPKE